MSDIHIKVNLTRNGGKTLFAKNKVVPDQYERKQPGQVQYLELQVLVHCRAGIQAPKNNDMKLLQAKVFLNDY